MGSDVNLDGSSVKFNKIGYDNAGIYSCETVNEYPEGKRKVKTLLSIQRDLRVKSEFSPRKKNASPCLGPYSWIYPLALIVLIFILLFITILFCEMRKKRLDRKWVLPHPSRETPANEGLTRRRGHRRGFGARQLPEMKPALWAKIEPGWKISRFFFESSRSQKSVVPHILVRAPAPVESRQLRVLVFSAPTIRSAQLPWFYGCLGAPSSNLQD